MLRSNMVKLMNLFTIDELAGDAVGPGSSNKSLEEPTEGGAASPASQRKMGPKKSIKHHEALKHL